MSIEVELVTTVARLVGVPEIAISLWQALRDQFIKKGVKDLPTDLVTSDEIDAAVKFLVNKSEEMSDAEANEVAVNALVAARRSTVEFRNERVRQARLAFNVALALSVIGVLIVFGGVILLFIRDSIAPGAITAGVGAISEIVSLLLFKLSNDANGRLDNVGQDLGLIDKARVAAELAKEIEDPSKRDDAIRAAANALQSTAKEDAA